MQIIIAKRAGFCFGVKRAIDIAFNLAKDSDKGIYTLGPLIHNPQVIDKLKRHGIIPVEDLHSVNIKTLIIRTHGIAPKVHEKISKMEYQVVDATCPFVKKAQQHAQTLKEEGYKVLILGDRHHPEVQALLGFAGDNVLIVNSNQPIPSVKGKIGIIVQTTQSSDTLKKVVCQIIDSVKEIKVYNTICDFTALRLEETKKIAETVDLMIVVGGKNSANTSQLTNLSKRICGKVYHIETADEFQNEWFSSVEKVGVTGGASTPQWIIDEVVEKLKEISCKR